MQWKELAELQCMFNQLNSFNMVLEPLSTGYLNHMARVVQFGAESSKPSILSARSGFSGPVEWLVLWGFWGGR